MLAEILGSCLVGGVLLLLVGFVIFKMYRDKKAGKSIICGGDCSSCGGSCHCSGNCSDCSSASSCHSDLNRK